MPAETKRREILQMLAKGSITAQEAGEMLEQVVQEVAAPESAEAPAEPKATAPGQPPGVTAEPGKPPRWLHVRVAELASGRNKVNVKIPLSLARVGLRMGAKFAPEVEEVNWNEVLSDLSSGEARSIVEVQDEEDGELVQIYLS
jgi:hypothetical protein